MFYALVFGLIVGSFVNVLVYRLPRGGGIVFSRSSCPKCSKIIVWYDLIPVFSFIFLGAKCRNCRQKISFVYPVVELLSAFIFIAPLLLFKNIGVSDYLFLVFILEIFLTFFFIDLKNLLLPDSLILAGIIGSVIYGIFSIFSKTDYLFHIFSITNLISATFYFLILFSIWYVSQGQWMGQGDAKLMFLVGLVFGPLGGLFILYLSFILGGGAGFVLLIFRKAGLKSKIPLGSFISLSVFAYVFLGHKILDILNLAIILR